MVEPRIASSTSFLAYIFLRQVPWYTKTPFPCLKFLLRLSYCYTAQYSRVSHLQSCYLIQLPSLSPHNQKMSVEDSGKKPVSVGPWGGNEGSRWDDGIYSTIKQLVIAHGAGIDSIQIEYVKKGCSIWSDKHGGTGGHKTDKVNLDFPDEFLTSIHGYYGTLNECAAVVRSLSFQSNKKNYGPFGDEQGTYFSFPMTGGMIVGFHGRCGWYLDAIGVYLKPLQQPKPEKALVHSQGYLTNTTENASYSVIQASVGQNYDIVLAVRQKDDLSKAMRNNASRNLSSRKEFNYSRQKEQVEKASSNSKVEGEVTYGPWGGNGGSIFDDGVYTGIRQINLSRNVGIVWIRVLYDQGGEAIWGSKQGGTGGYKNEKIIFDFPSEVLTHITGYHGPLMYMGPSIIKSLTFYTTKRMYGPYGDEQGTHFTTRLKEGKVVGIHGRKGLFLDALGVHVQGKVVTPVTTPSPKSNAIIRREPSIAEVESPQWPAKLVLTKPAAPIEEVACGVIKEPAPCGPGPWGGNEGRPWDDGVFSGIKQIYLARISEAICSIQIEYDRNGQSVWSVKHGSNGGDTMHRMKLEYPHEVLNCISGYYGSVSKDDRLLVIKSLTFYTSRGKYGPFGEEVGKFFTSTTTEGKIVGFHGRSSFYLDAIGVHMQHWLGNHKTSKSSLFKFF